MVKERGSDGASLDGFSAARASGFSLVGDNLQGNVPSGVRFRQA